MWHNDIKKYSELIKKQVNDLFNIETTETGKILCKKNILNILYDLFRDKSEEIAYNRNHYISTVSSIYMGCISCWKVTDDDEEIDEYIDSFIKKGSEISVYFFLEDVCLPLFKQKNINAVDIIVFKKIDVSQSFPEKLQRLVDELLNISELKELFVKRLLKHISKHYSLIETLLIIDHNKAIEVCIKWLGQSKIEKKYYSIRILNKIENLSKNQYKMIYDSMLNFWHNKKLREDYKATESYYRLIAGAYKNGAITKDEANKCLAGVFKVRGYVYPAEKESYMESLKTVNPKDYKSLYAKGFLNASRLKNEKIFLTQIGKQKNEIESILDIMSKEEKINFLEEIVVQTNDNKLLWSACFYLFDICNREKAGQIIKNALEVQNPERFGTLSQLIYRIQSENMTHGSIKLNTKEKKKKWLFLKDIIFDVELRSEEMIFSRAEQTVWYGAESDMLKLLLDFEILFNRTKDKEKLIKLILSGMINSKKKKVKRLYKEMLFYFYEKDKDEIVRIVTKAIKKDWRGGRLSEVLSYPALECIEIMDSNLCLPHIKRIINNRRGSGDLDITVITCCAKYILNLAIKGDEKALETLVSVPDKKVWGSVSSMLVEVVLKCKDNNLKEKAAKAIIARFKKAMAGANSEIYVHLEMESMEKIKDLKGIQIGFLNGVESSLRTLRKNQGTQNAYTKISEFVLPEYRTLAINTIKKGITLAKKSIETSKSKYHVQYCQSLKKEYDAIVVMLSEQIMQLAA